MSKLLLISLVSLSLVLANVCHPSCNCAPNSPVCVSCIHPDVSVMDSVQRSCKCKSNYYVASTNPFNCELSIEGTGTNGTGDTIDPCLIDIGDKTGDVLVNTDCHMDIDPVTDAHSVVSFFDLGFNVDSEMDERCKKMYISVPYYLEAGKLLTAPYTPLESAHWDVVTTKYGGIKMHWTLIEAYTYAYKMEVIVNPDQFLHNIKLLIQIKVGTRVYRFHHYDLLIYTYRNKVEAFKIDIDIQRTEDCSGDCIVIADLDVDGYICTDISCNTKRLPNGDGKYLYTVGDMFYAKIWFKDATYTKKLSLYRLYYANNDGDVFDHTSLSHGNWVNHALIVDLKLIEPSARNVIQIHMLIEPFARLRALQSTDDSTNISKQFEFGIQQKPADSAQAAQSNSALTLLFGVFNLIAILLLI